jgi:hypothetical protein
MLVSFKDAMEELRGPGSQVDKELKIINTSRVPYFGIVLSIKNNRG